MVTGMTPATVKAGIVFVIVSAGYHIELAGGGYYNPAVIHTKLPRFKHKFLQFPLWQEMRLEGLPMQGFCVTADIPSTEKAAEIIDGLRKKPAPFIPILDSNFEVWFKKHRIRFGPHRNTAAVFNQDPQRVCILQGPAAVKYSTVKDEPIKDLLGNITSCLSSSTPMGATEKLCDEDLEGEELWTKEELGIPVFNTEDGSGMRDSETSITCSLCDQIFTSPIHWMLATGFPETATHVIDFGPGGLNDIGPGTARGDNGRGEAELFDTEEVKYDEWWSKKYAPKLVKTSGTIHLDTPFSRLLGKPPIMVAGMTPTTVKAGFVSAVLSTGYHIELAGGGHYNPAALRAKVAEIQAQIPTGSRSTPSTSTHANSASSFCVAAGVPSTEKAAEIIDGLRHFSQPLERTS
ncbi:hypothetical protein C8R48DRAFT_768989 [Suillus tomentosus]|nr:hypothetical protein C8R48DRAFT_768989 [Suillus tomentosus]